jgi:integrase
MLEANATAATAATILLFAVYGLRCSEVRQLRLDDIDWDREIVTVRRAKCRKTQEFPLTREVGDAIIQYIREVRPKCEHREIFITLRAPWRPVSHVGFYDGIRERIDALGIDLVRRGPHSLRHYAASRTMPPVSARDPIHGRLSRGNAA